MRSYLRGVWGCLQINELFIMADTQSPSKSSDDIDSNALDNSSKSKKAKLTRKKHGAAVYGTKFNP